MEEALPVPDRDTGGHFNVLTVCTANVCRSPLMAALLLNQVGTNPGKTVIRVGSAGTLARNGSRICPVAARRVRNMGPLQAAYADSHRSRCLTAALADSADLIIVPDLANRSRVISVYPPARTRTFTLIEAVQLAQHLPDAEAEHLDGLVERMNECRVPLAAGRARGLRTCSDGSGTSSDIRDGHNLSVFGHLATLKQIANGVEALSSVLQAAQRSRA